MKNKALKVRMLMLLAIIPWLVVGAPVPKQPSAMGLIAGFISYLLCAHVYKKKSSMSLGFSMTAFGASAYLVTSLLVDGEISKEQWKLMSIFSACSTWGMCEVASSYIQRQNQN